MKTTENKRYKRKEHVKYGAVLPLLWDCRILMTCYLTHPLGPGTCL